MVHCNQFNWELKQRLCVGQLSATLTNTSDNQLTQSKGLFWLTVLEVPVCDWLALLLCDEKAHHGRSAWQNKATHLMIRKQKKHEEWGVVP
jgi:hypothetical protein